MLVTTAAYTDAIQAHIIRGRLAVEGIPAYVIHEQHIWANWFISNALGGVKIQVHPVHLEVAVNVINNIQNDVYEISLKEAEGEVEVVACPKCQANKTKECRSSEKIALIVLWFYSFPIPYRQGKIKCLECNYKWIEKSRNAYTPSAKWVVIICVTVFFTFVIFSFNTLCKMQYLNPQCYG